MPALLTSMSSRPYRSTVSPTAFSTCVRLVTSTFAANASIPSPTSCRAVAAAPSLFTSVKQTRAPSRANRRAIASPIPRPAPVTIATLPSSLPTRPPSVRAGHAAPRAPPGEPAGYRLPDPTPRPRCHRDPAVEPAHAPPFGRRSTLRPALSAFQPALLAFQPVRLSYRLTG